MWRDVPPPTVRDPRRPFKVKAARRHSSFPQYFLRGHGISALLKVISVNNQGEASHNTGTVSVWDLYSCRSARHLGATPSTFDPSCDGTRHNAKPSAVSEASRSITAITGLWRAVRKYMCTFSAQLFNEHFNSRRTFAPNSELDLQNRCHTSRILARCVHHHTLGPHHLLVPCPSTMTRPRQSKDPAETSSCTRRICCGRTNSESH